MHPGPEAYVGKKCVVLGSNNSAHDICAALWEHGADVTMIQRSSTHIAPSDSLMELALGGLYSEAAVKAGVTTDKADLIFASIPYKIMAPMQVPVYEEMKKREADLYARLEKAGFMLDFGPDGSGLFMKYLRTRVRLLHRCRRLRAGRQRQHQAEERRQHRPYRRALGHPDRRNRAARRPDRLRHGLRLDERLAGRDDFARGGGQGRQGLGPGLDTPKDPGPWEGELRNMWKPTQVPQLWFHGGNLHQSRHYSQFLALQLKARLENIPTPVYELALRHHKR
jgi:putative flavoprotein involved in K+ transport